MSFKYKNKWLFVRLEPFQTLNRQMGADDKKSTLNESYQYLNHHTTVNQKNLGFRQSGLFLTFYDLSIGYSNFNYWLSPGFHNSIHISSNPNGMKSFFLGTIKDKKLITIYPLVLKLLFPLIKTLIILIFIFLLFQQKLISIITLK